MDPERWMKIRSLFDRTYELPSEARRRALDESCAGDPALRAEVEALLSSFDVSGSLLEPIAAEVMATAAGGQPSDPQIGGIVGPYRVVRLIAYGGMGEVYEAVRDDGQFQKHVAVKLVRLGASRRDIMRRFESERRLLATLTHPNIAQLIDAGTLSDGVPYLMMEYVDGVRIDQYCDAHSLAVEQRLELFRTVCAALRFAHQHLVVHRDIKPGNILVSADGVPKLLDFGIAKLITEGGSSQERTLPGESFMTPEYASPEQARGEEATTVSDVYSLGVLLFKLLTGRRPYEFKSPAAHEISRVILETEPPKPSEVEIAIRVPGSPGDSLRKKLRGDLDAITLMALRKEPERRYQSVEEFSDDILRSLQRLPVKARSGAATYRLGRFVARHRTVVIGALLLLGAFAVGLAEVLWQTRQVRLERDRAQAEAEKSAQVARVLTDMLSAADLSRATQKDVTVDQVLDQASSRIATEFSNRPEIAADILSTIGASYQGIGRFDKAEVPLERSLELRRTLFGPVHPKVAAALHDLALLRHWQENLSCADSLYRASLEMFQRCAIASQDYAAALNDFGVYAMEARRFAKADSLFTSAITMYGNLRGDNRKDLASSLNNLALDKDWQKELSAADSLYRIALRIMRDVYVQDNNEIAIALSNLGQVVEERGDSREAEGMLRQSLAIRRRVLNADHPELLVQEMSLASHLALHTQMYDEAESLAKEALSGWLKGHPELHRQIGRARHIVGQVLERQGKLDSARAELLGSLEEFSRVSSPDAVNVADVDILLAETSALQGKSLRAKSEARKAYDLYRAALGPDAEETLNAARLAGITPDAHVSAP